MRAPLVLALLAVMATAIPAGSTAAPTRAALPRQGVLVPGKSLGGVALGDTRADVLGRWGSGYRVCDGCALPTLFFTYDDEADATLQGLGAGVVFRGGRVVAVFTLGMPTGWRTADGLTLGQLLPNAGDRYDGLRWKTCIGYIAMTLRASADAVTSIYTDGNTVYGFALTHRSQPVCQ
jgi:hypothetical protein